MPDPFLPYSRQAVDDADVAAVAEVLRSEYLTTGPAVGRFEVALQQATGARYAVALNSGTSALHAMYFAAGLGAGDEVITTPLTFAATSNAALYLGATVRFADVRPDTGNLDPEAVAPLINERTRLIVPVDYAGHPADYNELSRLAADYSITVLADAAHSLGASYRGRAVGRLAHASAVSFHPVKPVTTGEGGAVLTGDPDLAARVARFRTHGITRDRSLMETDEGPWYYQQLDLGFNYRLTDVQAALGTSQLDKLDRFIRRRRAIATRYLEALSEIPSLTLPAVADGVEPGWHLFVLRIAGDPERRRPFFERLRESGLGVQVHYIPVYWHPFYRRLAFARGLCPKAEDFYARAVSIPIYPTMSDADMDRVIETVSRVARDVL